MRATITTPLFVGFDRARARRRNPSIRLDVGGGTVWLSPTGARALAAELLAGAEAADVTAGGDAA